MTSPLPDIRIAALVPSTYLIDGELCALAAQRGASAHVFRVAPKVVAAADDADAVADMAAEMGAPDILAAVAATAADIDPHVVIWACTSGSFIADGAPADTQAAAMSKALDGIAATSTSLAMVNSIRRAAPRRLAVVTPYHQSIGIQFVQYLEQCGIPVESHAHVGCGSDAEVSGLGPSDLIRVAKGVLRGNFDAVAIPCTALRRAGVSEAFRVEFGAESILANESTLDEAIRLVANL